jgi:uncharacterized protein
MSDNHATPWTKQNYISLETYRKSGKAVATPVWFVQEGQTLLVITGAGSGKVKRIRNNPQVQVVPCKYNGQLLGQWVKGSAQCVNDAAEQKRIDALLRKKYGLQKALFDFFGRFSKAQSTALKIQL